MHDSFNEEVLKIFADLIDKHQLEVEVEETYSVTLLNESIALTFVYNPMLDRGDFQPKLLKVDDDYYAIGLEEMVDYLLPQLSKVALYEDYPLSAVRFYAQLFRKELQPILLGDFHWYEGLKAQKLYENCLMREFWKLDKAHPIPKKFWQGDKTWRTDLEAYVEVNNIPLNHTKPTLK